MARFKYIGAFDGHTDHGVCGLTFPIDSAIYVDDPVKIEKLRRLAIILEVPDDRRSPQEPQPTEQPQREDETPVPTVTVDELVKRKPGRPRKVWGL
jgi:hypothetical protein